MSRELQTPAVDRVGDLLKAREQTVAVAESSTGGLIAASLLSVAGASAYFLGGSVVYTLLSRRELLEIRARDVEGLKPLSEPMVQRFAKRAREQLGATWGIAELGAAGPAGARYGHAAGTCVLAVDGPVSLTMTVETGRNDRESNMWEFTSNAIGLLEQALSADAGR